MSAWDDASRDPADAIPIRGAGRPPGPVDYWWRMIGTDIEVRVSPSFDGGQVWQHQHAPTGLLTIHLLPEPVEAVEDPLLAPIETPGPTLVRQAEWDEETQTWKAP